MTEQNLALDVGLYSAVGNKAGPAHTGGVPAIFGGGLPEAHWADGQFADDWDRAVGIAQRDHDESGAAGGAMGQVAAQRSGEAYHGAADGQGLVAGPAGMGAAAECAEGGGESVSGGMGVVRRQAQAVDQRIDAVAGAGAGDAARDTGYDGEAQVAAAVADGHQPAGARGTQGEGAGRVISGGGAREDTGAAAAGGGKAGEAEHREEAGARANEGVETEPRAKTDAITGDSYDT
jgi:hypothetical protein